MTVALVPATPIVPKYVAPKAPHVTLRNASKVAAKTVNDVSDKQEQVRNVTLLAANSVIPVTFGEDQFNPKPYLLAATSSTIYIGYLVGKGPIGGYKTIKVDDVDIYDSTGFLSFAGAGIETYTGEAGQAVSPYFQVAIAGYSDALAGKAHIVLKVPKGSTSGFPRLSVEIYGLKVRRYDLCTIFESTGATAGANNYIPYSAKAASWTNSGATLTTNGNIGMFTETRIASTGGASNRAHVALDRKKAVYAITVYYKLGTSGKFKLWMRDTTASLESTISGAAIGSMSVSSSAAGTVLLLDDRELGSYAVLRALFIPTTYTNAMLFGIGPDSTTSGQYVTVYGMQVEDSSEEIFGLPMYTANPVNISAHLMTEKAKWTVNATKAISAAHWCNDILEGEKNGRRSMGMTYSQPESLTALIQNLRAYTGCYYAWEDGELVFVPYRLIPDSEGYHVLNSDNIQALAPVKKRQREIPTVVVVEYTDAKDNYQKREVTVKAAGVDAGTVSRRISRVNLPGIHHRNMAKREAIERINTGLSDLALQVDLYDEALKIQVGDKCLVTDPLGLLDKPMFVTRLAQQAAGLWTAYLEEYQPELFSEVVEGDPTFSDTNLPVHTQPAAVENLVATEELYQRKNGQWDNRIRIRWDRSGSPYVQWYIVRVRHGGVLISSENTSDVETTFGPVMEEVTYTVEVTAVTSLYEGLPGVTSITPIGKFRAPTNVTGFSGYEVGGEVRFSWDPAIDLDLIGYEIRYGTAGVSWENAQLVDRVSALRYKTKEIPPATWDFLIKAKDSTGHESVAAARISSLTVTLDSQAYLVDSGSYPDSATADLLVHRVVEVRGETDVIYTNSASQTWSALFGAATLNSKTNELASYQSAPASNFQWESGQYDLSVNAAGDFRQLSDWKEYSGTLVENMALKPNAGSFTYYSQLSKKTQARYGKMRVQGIGLGRIPTTDQLYRVDATTNTESGSATTAGIAGVTVTLSNVYSKVKLISVTVDQGGSGVGYNAVVDNLIVGSPTSFDVYVFDSSDNPVSKLVYWTFEGV